MGREKDYFRLCQAAGEKEDDCNVTKISWIPGLCFYLIQHLLQLIGRQITTVPLAYVSSGLAVHIFKPFSKPGNMNNLRLFLFCRTKDDCFVWNKPFANGIQ